MDTGKNAGLFLHQSLYWNDQYAKLMQKTAMFFSVIGIYMIGLGLPNNLRSFQGVAAVVNLCVIAFSIVVQIAAVYLNLSMRLVLKDKPRTRVELVKDLNCADYDFGQSPGESAGKTVLERITTIAYVNRSAAVMFLLAILLQFYVIIEVTGDTYAVSLLLWCIPVFSLMCVIFAIFGQMSDYYRNGGKYINYPQ